MSIQDTLKPTLINIAMRILVDKRLWNDAKMFVDDLMTVNNMTKEEKHSKVKYDLQLIFKDVGTSLLDAVIKIAYIWASNKAKGMIGE